jgi:hypothetical protein
LAVASLAWLAWRYNSAFFPGLQKPSFSMNAAAAAVIGVWFLAAAIAFWLGATRRAEVIQGWDLPTLVVGLVAGVVLLLTWYLFAKNSRVSPRNSALTLPKVPEPSQASAAETSAT